MYGNQNAGADVGLCVQADRQVGPTPFTEHRDDLASAQRNLEANARAPLPTSGARGSVGRNTPGRRPALRTSARHAFTLIELILVLAILAIVTTLAAPSLFNFFRGRTLDAEARQLLALTHAGQSRAVSEGFPMLLWFDSQGHEYGLQAQLSSQKGGAQDADPKAQEFTYGDQLAIEPLNASALPVNGRNLPAIRFLPDGSIDEGSPTAVRITSLKGDTLWLVEATNRLSYAISQSDK